MASESYDYKYVYEIDLDGNILDVVGSDLSGAFLETAQDFGDATFTVGETVYVFGDSGNYQAQLTYYGFLGTGPTSGVILFEGPPGSGKYFLYSNDVYTLGQDAGTTTSGTSSDPFCIARGTFVDVPGGRVRVEDLRPGDVVMTSEGDEAAVRWIGRQTHRPSVGARDTRPVIVRAGAIDVSVPDADLTVSADHGILIDDVLVNARALVNGATVAFADVAAGETVDYFHLELDDHRTVLANGAPVESFVDNVSRQGFDNYDEWVALGLEPLPSNPTPFLRAKSARQVPQRVRDRMAARAEALGTGEDAVAV
jgi:hypothetical protein